MLSQNGCALILHTNSFTILDNNHGLVQTSCNLFDAYNTKFDINTLINVLIIDDTIFHRIHQTLNGQLTEEAILIQHKLNLMLLKKTVSSILYSISNLILYASQFSTALIREWEKNSEKFTYDSTGRTKKTILISIKCNLLSVFLREKKNRVVDCRVGKMHFWEIVLRRYDVTKSIDN